MYKLGIDLGGTKIEGIVLDKDLNEVFRKRVSTEQEKGYDYILNKIHALYIDLASSINNATHTFGIGTPGAISKKTDLLINSNTQCLNNKPFLKDLEEKLKRKVAIENDANCFAMAEALMGAGKGKELVFGVIMGTGCGGGIVYQGKLFRGLQGISGEWGHMSIDPNGPECYCGKRGCVETFISGGGLEKGYLKLTGVKKTLKEIISEYRQNEPVAVEFIDDFYSRFGIALANVINIVDPDAVVLGGGVSNVEEIYSKGIEKVKQFVFNDTLETPILKNKTGDSAGVWGAALIGV